MGEAPDRNLRFKHSPALPALHAHSFELGFPEKNSIQVSSRFYRMGVQAKMCGSPLVSIVYTPKRYPQSKQANTNICVQKVSLGRFGGIRIMQGSSKWGLKTKGLRGDSVITKTSQEMGGGSLRIISGATSAFLLVRDHHDVVSFRSTLLTREPTKIKPA